MALATAPVGQEISNAARICTVNTALTRPTLEWTPAIERETASIYARVQHVIPPVEWPFHAPYISAINRLKK